MLWYLVKHETIKVDRHLHPLVKYISLPLVKRKKKVLYKLQKEGWTSPEKTTDRVTPDSGRK